MLLKTIKSISLALIILISSNAIAQQLKVPAASPLQTVKQAFGLSEITIEYSRPSVKGRVIFGDVVPFGKIWRTGANSTTKITFGDDVKVEGIDVKAGTYGFYTIPNADSWEIMLYKDLTLGGNVSDYKIENEVLRVKVKPTVLGNKVETFTMGLADITFTSTNIELTWENTRVAVSVVTEIDSKIMKSIENTIVKDTRPFYQAASYYYENNKDLKQALEWAEKAIVANPKAFWVVLLKAKIQLKLNDKKGAIATANQVIIMATADKDDSFIKQAEKLIASAK
ncbi:MAG: DUF2911 domain-containing protein [Bacteroidia bacterium]|nr:DUF2911 domain-containing protein [Bacteroidia bacterium]